MSAVVEGRDLFLIHRGRHHEVAALRGLTVSVEAGEVVAVLGPSGAGKSSLLSLCAGLARPSSGTLTVAGVDVGSASARRRAELRRARLGIVRQHFTRALPAELTAREIVELPLRLRGLPARAAGELLEAAGLGERAGAYPAELSGGEQQRVAVCAAVVSRPALVLADEPTGELDSTASAAVVELIVRLSTRDGGSALIVTHDPRVADRADRTIHLRDGRLSAEGAANPLLVVDDQGWLRLPRSVREEAGVGGRVRALARPGLVELHAQAAAPAEPAREHAAFPVRRRGGAEVELAGVAKRHGRAVVFAGLSHRFPPGAVHVVAGPSGSGKTTLLDLIAGADVPDAGALTVDGVAPAALGDRELAEWRRANLGYLSQHSVLSGFLSVAENAGALRRRADVDAVLEWIGIAHLAGRRADRLSGGEQRRVALARALVSSPRLLVADEPTAHLDRVTGRAIIALLRVLAREGGATVVAASHDPELIAAADAVLDLEAVQALSAAR